MKLPKQELLKGSRDPQGMGMLLNQAEDALQNWSPTWSPFISAPLREEAMEIIAPLHNLHWQSDGGHPEAERQRMKCIHCTEPNQVLKEIAPISGLRLEGNFLFDKATPSEISKALEINGVSSGGIGDIWLRNDRGAQALCTPEAANALNGASTKVRDVKIICERVEVSELQLPPQRLRRHLRTVEASPRIDSIASAGFGLSRAKVVKQIKEGRLRLNWEPIHQSSKKLSIGDRIQHEDKGKLEVLNLELTKRQRWRVELLRS